MKVKVGNKSIDVVSILSDRVWYADVSRPALHINLDHGISDDEITALINNKWELFDDDGNFLGMQENVNTLISHNISFCKTEPLEVELSDVVKKLEIVEKNLESTEQSLKEAEERADVALNTAIAYFSGELPDGKIETLTTAQMSKLSAARQSLESNITRQSVEDGVLQS